MKTIAWKSEPAMWKLEQSGRKANTVRAIEEGDPRAAALRDYIANGGQLEVAITNTADGMTFRRTVQSVVETTRFGVPLFIVSWTHKPVFVPVVCPRCLKAAFQVQAGLEEYAQITPDRVRHEDGTEWGFEELACDSCGFPIMPGAIIPQDEEGVFVIAPRVFKVV